MPQSTRVHACVHVHTHTHTAQLCEQVKTIYAHFIVGTITKQTACMWKQFRVKADARRYIGTAAGSPVVDGRLVQRPVAL
jgi:hypothetical protein